MRIKISETLHPPIGMKYYPSICKWERGQDPFNTIFMPDGFKDCGNQGTINNGWFGEDWCGNQICFVKDGTEYGND